MSNIRINGDGTTNVGGVQVNTPYDNDKGGVKVDDFLQLMIAQMTNQDFMNPADDTQYITQMAQFATMEAMKELSYYSQTNYVAGLVGKSVTVASLGLGGQMASETGVVTSVNLSGDEYTVTVNGKPYKMNQIMSVSTESSTNQTELDAAKYMTAIVQKQTQNSVSIRWDAPLKDEAKNGDLRYDVYYTTDGQADLTNLTNVKKGQLAGENLTSNNLNITGLEPGKTYFISVVVRNQSGATALYQHATTTTLT